MAIKQASALHTFYGTSLFKNHFHILSVSHGFTLKEAITLHTIIK